MRCTNQLAGINAAVAQHWRAAKAPIRVSIRLFIATHLDRTEQIDARLKTRRRLIRMIGMPLMCNMIEIFTL